jgi:DNA-binding NtrC family response regulator
VPFRFYQVGLAGGLRFHLAFSRGRLGVVSGGATSGHLSFVPLSRSTVRNLPRRVLPPSVNLETPCLQIVTTMTSGSSLNPTLLRDHGLDPESVLAALSVNARPLLTILDRLVACLGASFAGWMELDKSPPLQCGRSLVVRQSRAGHGEVRVTDKTIRDILDQHVPFPGEFLHSGLEEDSKSLWHVSSLSPLPEEAALDSAPHYGLVVGGKVAGLPPLIRNNVSEFRALIERITPHLSIASNLEASVSEDVDDEPILEELPYDALYIPEFPDIIAVSRSMRHVLHTVSRVAPTDAAVLIEGESGTGKEVIARALHDRSHRRNGPLLSENCAACPGSLLESEFFGVERGAYTGASVSRPGIFERACNGTLVLDEIGEMDLVLQAKLLRVLQEREVRRVGGSNVVPVDFRLIASTNRDLKHDVQARRFRLDLLYRLEVVNITIPPLRERKEDIPHLARHFLSSHTQRLDRPLPKIRSDALQRLIEYPWPGNVRELENEMSRAIVFGHNVIRERNLSDKLRSARSSSFLSASELESWSFRQIERDVLGSILEAALRHTGGSGRQAAQLLSLPKTTFYRKLQHYGITASPSPSDGSHPIASALARYRFLDGLLAPRM